MPAIGAEVATRRLRESARARGGDETSRLWLAARPLAPGDPAAQARAVYREISLALAASGASAEDLVGETIFARDPGDLAEILAERSRSLVGSAPAPSFVGQTPVDGSALEVAANAIVPGTPGDRTVVDVRAARACPCEGCALSAARIVRRAGCTILRTSGLHGIGASLFEQAIDAFRSGERLLRETGLGFRDVVRTWVWLRDIDRDYDELNAARRAFFEEVGLERRPASTGVQGAPPGERHDVSIVLEAQAGPARAGAASGEPMTTPLLNEAWTYGADFSRGLGVPDEDGTTLSLSGTASIDEQGRTVHAGDLAAQAARMIDNVESLLAGRGAGFGDLVSGVVYAKRREDGPALREICRARGFDGFPCVFVEAPLCRPELLCEAEAVARLSLPAAGA